MSEVKVNKISPRTACGTVTLGDSGDTFTIPSGATITNNGTQTGFGRTGTVDWQTDSIKTATFTATSGEGYFANTTGGVFNMNLPAGAAGSIVAVKDYLNTFDSNALTIVPNGSDKIGGTNANYEVTTESLSLTLIYVDATRGWVDVHESTQAVKGGTYMTATVSGSCNTLANCGNYKIATFKGPGTFCVSSIASCATNNIIDYAVVAGGGAGPATGGGDGISGGGGGGGFRFYANTTTNPQTGPAAPINNFPSGTAITVSATGYPITIGGGGPKGTAPSGWSNGSDSVFSTITSTGGGRGGRGDPSPTGQDGGSGGGGDNGDAGGSGNTPATPIAQGTNGGTASGVSAGGGGGGALVAGTAGANPSGGAGGAGAGVTGFGTTGQSCGGQYYFAGGGGGGNGNANFPAPGGAAGLGGGAAGLNPASPSPTSSNGTDYTGGGGGGASDKAPVGGGGGAGGNGGGGIVIIRYRFQ
jgi:hypothetical protein